MFTMRSLAGMSLRAASARAAVGASSTSRHVLRGSRLRLQVRALRSGRDTAPTQLVRAVLLAHSPRGVVPARLGCRSVHSGAGAACSTGNGAGAPAAVSGEGAGAAAAEAVPPVTRAQLRQLMFTSAVPMVGFGMMDNFVMIQAGELIDLTLGVTFGLSTLTAAACGQVFSDVAGVTFGGTVDALAAKLGLPVVDISARQRASRPAKIASTFGAAVGVVIGCFIGMTSLLFMDLDRAERMKREQELDTLFETVIKQGANVLGAQRCTLWMVDREKGVVWSKVFNHQVYSRESLHREEVPMDSGIVGWVVANKTGSRLDDAYKDERFNPDMDLRHKFTTKSVLTEPVFNSAGDVVAVVQVVNKVDGTSFDSNDERLLEMLAAHVTVFMRIVTKDESM